MSLREKIKSSAVVLPSETVHVPEWGQKVELRGMTAADADAYQALIRDKAGNIIQNGWREKYIATCIYENGKRVFEPWNLDDVDQLSRQDNRLIARLFILAQALNGDGAAGEELEKNLSTTQNGDSNTD